MSKGWGFKINYAEAIRDDERRIACLTEQLAKGWFRAELPTGLPERPTWTALDLRDLVLYVPGVAATVPLTPQEVADYVDYAEINDRLLANAHPNLPTPTKGREGYDRAKAIAARLDAHTYLEPSAELARVSLRKAKTSLSRHRRNQATYG